MAEHWQQLHLLPELRGTHGTKTSSPSYSPCLVMVPHWQQGSLLPLPPPHKSMGIHCQLLFSRTYSHLKRQLL